MDGNFFLLKKKKKKRKKKKKEKGNGIRPCNPVVEGMREQLDRHDAPKKMKKEKKQRVAVKSKKRNMLIEIVCRNR